MKKILLVLCFGLFGSLVANATTYMCPQQSSKNSSMYLSTVSIGTDGKTVTCHYCVNSAGKYACDYNDQYDAATTFKSASRGDGSWKGYGDGAYYCPTDTGEGFYTVVKPDQCTCNVVS